MSDDANVAAEAASATAQPEISTPAASAPAVDTQQPPVSSREALERAFQSVAAPVDAKPDRARDETGKFAKADPAAKPEVSAKPADALKPVVTDPLKAPEVKPAEKIDAKPVGNVPAGFTKAAADAWGQTPEPVRADVERRLTELTQGIEGYKQQIEPIRKYVDMAKQHGTTLDTALANYTGMEDLLSRDFVGGVRLLCQNMGFNPAQLVASLTGQQVNGAHGELSPEVSQLRQTNQALEQKIAKLEEKFGGFETTFQDTRAAEMIERFSSSHPHFDELRPSISEMLSTGYAKDLSDAYEKAVRLNPDVFAKVEAEKAAKAAPQSQTLTPDPAQTRSKAALSVTGSPPVGSNPSSRKPAGSTREALQNAFGQVGL